MTNPTYNPVHIVDAVRALRTYINAMDNVQFQLGHLHIVRRHLEDASKYDFEAMVSQMEGLSSTLVDLVSQLEETSAYKLLVPRPGGTAKR